MLTLVAVVEAYDRFEGAMEMDDLVSSPRVESRYAMSWTRVEKDMIGEGWSCKEDVSSLDSGSRVGIAHVFLKALNVEVRRTKSFGEGEGPDAVSLFKLGFSGRRT